MARVYESLEKNTNHTKLLKNLAIYPDEILSVVATKFIDEELNNFEYLNHIKQKMFDIMYYFGGIGLAGPQANVGKRILVVDLCVNYSFPLQLLKKLRPFSKNWKFALPKFYS